MITFIQHQILDRFFALILTFLFIPLIIIISLIIKLTSKGDVIHWSKRIGINNDFFWMPKFRTMKAETPQLATHLLTNGSNYSYPFGSFLRKTSLDELPQLYSVLKGDMAFVGPRPALFNQDDLKKMRTAFGIEKVRPGITGWAQINGRDEISLEKKVELDKEYLDNKNLFFDIRIIILTIVKVLGKKNISH